jgi:hypothetical protein
MASLTKTEDETGKLLFFKDPETHQFMPFTNSLMRHLKRNPP